MATLCFEVLFFRLSLFLHWFYGSFFIFWAYLCRVVEWLRLEFASGCGHPTWSGVGRASSSKDNYAREYFGTFSDLPEDAT